MPRKIKIEELIESNVKLHDNFYDLSKTDLNNRLKRNKIIIICPKHGQFLIAPFDFIHGRGCPVCGKEKRQIHSHILTIILSKKQTKYIIISIITKNAITQERIIRL